MTTTIQRLCGCGRAARRNRTECGACESRAYRARRRAGKTASRPRVDLNEVVHLLADGTQLPEVARRLGVHPDSIRNVARARQATEDAAIAAGEQQEYSVLLARLLRLLAAESSERAAYATAVQVARRAGGWWR